MNAALQSKIRIAAPVMTKAGIAALAKGPVTAGELDNALNAAFAERLPAVQTAAMADAVRSTKEYASKACFAPEAAAAPAVDGDLSDEAWRGVPETTGFYGYGGGLPARYWTAFKFVTHQDRLYGAFTCRQDMTKPKAGGVVRDSNVWLDDAVEIFLNRPDAKASEEFLQVIVNVKGVIFDQWRKNPKWDGDIQVGTKEQTDGWTLEVSLPLRDVGMAPSQTRGLRLNVVRNCYGPGPGNAPEVSPWFPTTFGHSDLNLRGWLFFTGK
jgi:hypothetical protein